MTTRSQMRNAVAELVSGDFEASVAETSQTENQKAGPNKSPEIRAESLDEIKLSLRKGSIVRRDQDLFRKLKRDAKTCERTV